MRFHTYTKHSPQAADAVDLESLLEKLADFLLQSGFAGGPYSHPYWGDFGGESDHTLEALKEAILRALLESGEFTPEMLAALRGANDPEAKAKLSQLLDDLVRRLAERGYLNVDAPPRVDDGHQPVIGPARWRERPRATWSSSSPKKASTFSPTAPCASCLAR